MLGAMVVLLAALGGYQTRAFDSYVHMFFADHYVRDWFNLWEPRWYGGFAVTSYPPLAHQVLALFSIPLGLERAYLLLTALIYLGIIFQLRRLAAIFAPKDRIQAVQDWALVLGIFLPTVHRFAYVYGQFAMLFATPFALWAMVRLHHFLRDGGPKNLGLFLSLVATTACAHHVSTIFIAGGCILISFRHLLQWLKERPIGLGRLVLRAGLAGFLSAVTIITVIWPFWSFAQGEPQAEIPHISRMPFMQRPVNLEWLEHIAYLGLGALLVLAHGIGRRWLLALLAAGVVFLSTLALGMTTPLPQLLFGGQAHWLTYDKFHFWSSLLLSVLMAERLAALGSLLLVRLQVRGMRLSSVHLAIALGVLLMPLALVEVGHKGSELLQPPPVKDFSKLLSVLRQEGAENYRHLSLGFGDQFCRLSIWSNSANVDGDYHTARNDPALRQSGMATVDASKYYPAGPKMLTHVLGSAPKSGLRWVFVYDEWYYPYLFEAGFDLKEVWQNGVSLFEFSDAPKVPLDRLGPKALQTTVWRYLWGIIPITALCLSLFLGLLGPLGLLGRSKIPSPQK